MGFIDITEQMLNRAFTENKGIAYETTGSYCLDYFSLVGGMRYNPDQALNLFMKSYKEDPILTLKILFYLRDIRNGLGERNLFRLTFSFLSSMYPDVSKQLLKYIPTIGRWDDIFSCFDTPIRKEMLDMIRNQIIEDTYNMENNKPISLLSKWMPSINTSSYETRDLALRLCDALGMKKSTYRQMLSKLRKGLIIENNLRNKDYTFNYEEVPGNALFKYQKAFLRNDNERYQEYLNDVSNNNAKMNVKTIYPYEVIRKFDNFERYGQDLTKEEVNSLDTIWESFNNEPIAGKTIVVRDGSYSMYDQNSVSAESVATSLTMLFASRLTGEFKNRFITFSREPKLVKIEGKNAFEKYLSIVKYNEATNTNIQKVYDLILNVYQSNNFNPKDALDRIVLISDMEFDNIEDFDDTSYNYFKNKFNELGFNIPEVIFWNVRCRNVHFPATKEDSKVKLISGSSSLLIDSIIKNDGKSSYDYMLECLKEYDFLDNIKF